MDAIYRIISGVLFWMCVATLVHYNLRNKGRNFTVFSCLRNL